MPFSKAPRNGSHASVTKGRSLRAIEADARPRSPDRWRRRSHDRASNRPLGVTWRPRTVRRTSPSRASRCSCSSGIRRLKRSGTSARSEASSSGVKSRCFVSLMSRSGDCGRFNISRVGYFPVPDIISLQFAKFQKNKIHAGQTEDYMIRFNPARNRRGLCPAGALRLAPRMRPESLRVVTRQMVHLQRANDGDAVSRE
jgi:hypothetical protein